MIQGWWLVLSLCASAPSHGADACRSVYPFGHPFDSQASCRDAGRDELAVRARRSDESAGGFTCRLGGAPRW